MVAVNQLILSEDKGKKTVALYLVLESILLDHTYEGSQTLHAPT